MITETTQTLTQQENLHNVTVRETYENGFNEVLFGSSPEECFEQRDQQGLPQVVSHTYTQDSELFNVLAESRNGERRIRIDLAHPDNRGLQIAIVVDGIGTNDIRVYESSYFQDSEEYTLSHRYDSGVSCASSAEVVRVVGELLQSSSSPALDQYNDVMVRVVEYELDRLS